MKTQEFEGQTWILKSDVDGLVQKRISSVSERARAAETQLTEMKGQIAQAQTATAQFEAVSGELAQIRQQFDRHRTMSGSGFSDPEIIAAVGWSYDRQIANMAKKDRPTLGAWLEGIKADPSTAPAVLRPHLQPAQAPPQAQQFQQPPQAQQFQQPHAAQIPPAQPQIPTPNNGAIAQSPDPSAGDLLTKGLTDPEFYSQNRDRIRDAWFHQQGKTPPYRY